MLVSALEASVSGSSADDERDDAAPESRPLPPAQRILHSVFAECLRVRRSTLFSMQMRIRSSRAVTMLCRSRCYTVL